MDIGLRRDTIATKTKATGLDLGVVVESEEGDKLGSNFPVLGAGRR